MCAGWIKSSLQVRLLRYLSPLLKTEETQITMQKENALTLLSKDTVLYLIYILFIFEEVVIH